jgi:predicted component of type VI protein secretion system
VTSNVLQVRLDEHARRLRDLEETKPAVIANEVSALSRDFLELRDEMRALKRALYGLTISIASGAVIFAFTAFQIWGGK